MGVEKAPAPEVKVVAQANAALVNPILSKREKWAAGVLGTIAVLGGVFAALCYARIGGIFNQVKPVYVLSGAAAAGGLALATTIYVAARILTHKPPVLPVEKPQEADGAAAPATTAAAPATVVESHLNTLVRQLTTQALREAIAEITREGEAATTIQAAWKGHAARKEYSHRLANAMLADVEENTYKNLAARTIQAAWRGHAARKAVTTMRQATVESPTKELRRSRETVLKLARSIVARHVSVKKDRAASTIQVAWKGHAARKAAEANAATTLQAVMRGYAARKALPDVKEAKIQAVIESAANEVIVKRLRENPKQKIQNFPMYISSVTERVGASIRNKIAAGKSIEEAKNLALVEENIGSPMKVKPKSKKRKGRR